MLAGAGGAVTGDSALYWLARVSGRRFQERVEPATHNERVATAMALIGSRASVLLCFGRYVPGLRFVVNAPAVCPACHTGSSSSGRSSEERCGPS